MLHVAFRNWTFVLVVDIVEIRRPLHRTNQCVESVESKRNVRYVKKFTLVSFDSSVAGCFLRFLE